MVCLGRLNHFKFFKGCLPQILLGPFLNILTQIIQFVLYAHLDLQLQILNHLGEYQLQKLIFLQQKHSQIPNK